MLQFDFINGDVSDFSITHFNRLGNTPKAALADQHPLLHRCFDHPIPVLLFDEAEEVKRVHFFLESCQGEAASDPDSLLDRRRSGHTNESPDRRDAGKSDSHVRSTQAQRSRRGCRLRTRPILLTYPLHQPPFIFKLINNNLT